MRVSRRRKLNITSENISVNQRVSQQVLSTRTSQLYLDDAGYTVCTQLLYIFRKTFVEYLEQNSFLYISVIPSGGLIWLPWEQCCQNPPSGLKLGAKHFIVWIPCTYIFSIHTISTGWLWSVCSLLVITRPHIFASVALVRNVVTSWRVLGTKEQDCSGWLHCWDIRTQRELLTPPRPRPQQIQRK